MGDRLEGKVAIITGGTSGIGSTVSSIIPEALRLLVQLWKSAENIDFWISI